MEEYMKVLMEQIRCKKAHPYIREEIQGHIEEQIKENMMSGMSMEEAEKAAVEDMGSPVEVGVSLDRIHKPQIAWGMIGLMALISVAGIILHQIMSSQTGEQAVGSSEFVMYTIVGFILMLIVYHIDYSVIARFSKIIAAVVIGMCMFGLIGGEEVNGTKYYISIGTVRIALFSVMTLYVPLYGAVIYKDHGSGYRALLKSVMWMLVPVFIAFYLPNLSLAWTLLISMSVVLTVAIVHDWFTISKKKVIAVLWGCILGLPAAGLVLALLFDLLAPYQVARLQAFLTASGDANYMTAMLRANLLNSQFIGSSQNELTESLLYFNSSYILSYILSTYGLLLGAVICCTLLVLVVKIFSISFRQKNQLGMCMGCGCGVIILLNVIINVGVNTGLLPLARTFLPFFSTGGSSIIVCYILMGIILSIYRYKNIYPTYISTKLSAVKITMNL